jgi:hypothetical protein
VTKRVRGKPQDVRQSVREAVIEVRMNIQREQERLERFESAFHAATDWEERAELAAKFIMGR